MGGGCSSSLSFKTLLGTLIIVLVFVILVGIVQISEGNKTTSWTTIKTSDNERSISIATPTGKLQHAKPDLYYMSKRRVPNGPDPIHNRRAGNSRRPPGQN